MPFYSRPGGGMSETTTIHNRGGNANASSKMSPLLLRTTSEMLRTAAGHAPHDNGNGNGHALGSGGHGHPRLLDTPSMPMNLSIRGGLQQQQQKLSFEASKTVQRLLNGSPGAKVKK